MNCKPNQLAWIKVPREYHGTGLEQLNNRVVQALHLVPGFPQPTWRITPAQEVKFSRFSVDHSGSAILPGEVRWTDSLPDALLRPFDPDSAPLNEPAARTLETAR